MRSYTRSTRARLIIYVRYVYYVAISRRSGRRTHAATRYRWLWGPPKVDGSLSMLVWLHLAVPYERPTTRGVCVDLKGGAARSGPGARADSKRRRTRRGRDSAAGADILLVMTS